MGSEEGDGHGRGRPRDPDVDEAILQATVRTLRERGWGATTVEDVASEAGVSKASIYRRYRSKVALVADAATHDRKEHFPSFDTGSMTGDMMTFVAWATDRVRLAPSAPRRPGGSGRRSGREGGGSGGVELEAGRARGNRRSWHRAVRSIRTPIPTSSSPSWTVPRCSASW